MIKVIDIHENNIKSSRDKLTLHNLVMKKYFENNHDQKEVLDIYDTRVFNLTLQLKNQLKMHKRLYSQIIKEIHDIIQYKYSVEITKFNKSIVKF